MSGKNGATPESAGDRAVIHARQQMRLARKLVDGALDESFASNRSDPRAEAAVCGGLARLFAQWAQAAWKTPLMAEVIERLSDPDIMRPDLPKPPSTQRLWRPGDPTL